MSLEYFFDFWTWALRIYHPKYTVNIFPPPFAVYNDEKLRSRTSNHEGVGSNRLSILWDPALWLGSPDDMTEADIPNNNRPRSDSLVARNYIDWRYPKTRTQIRDATHLIFTKNFWEFLLQGPCQISNRISQLQISKTRLSSSPQLVTCTKYAQNIANATNRARNREELLKWFTFFRMPCNISSNYDDYSRDDCLVRYSSKYPVSRFTQKHTPTPINKRLLISFDAIPLSSPQKTSKTKANCFEYYANLLLACLISSSIICLPNIITSRSRRI